MTALLRAEVLKIRTTRTFLAQAGAAVATSLLLTGLTAALMEPTEESVLLDVFSSDTSGIFVFLLAVIGITGEWRHRTIAGSLLAAPDRRRFLAAKTLAFAAVGLALSVAVSTAVAVVGYAFLSARGLPVPAVADVATQGVRLALLAAIGGGFGVALGGLVKNQAGAVVAVLLAALLIEPVLIALIPEVARFGPFAALPTAALGLSATEAGLPDVDLLAPGLAWPALVAWVAAAFAAASELLRRRDLE